MTLKIKRIYEPAEKGDGFRILVDRLWPRGIKKEEAAIDLWLKDAAPSSDLRKWFGHDVQRFKEFEKKYREELQQNEPLKSLRKLMKEHPVITLLYGAKDREHNQAVVIKDVLANSG